MLEDNDITRIYKANVKALLPLKPQTIDMPLVKINSIRINDACLLLDSVQLHTF